MAAGLPKITIQFRQLAETFAKRSERGVGFLIAKDTTAGDMVTEINNTNVDDMVSRYTPGTMQQIKDVLQYGIFKLFVVKWGTDTELAEVLDKIKATYSSGRITLVGTAEDYAELVQFVKKEREAGKTYHALCYKAAKPDTASVESFYNETVVFKDGKGEQPGAEFLPSLLGVLCACNTERGATYFTCENLEKCSETTEIDTAINAGNIVLFNDCYNGVNEVRIGAGVNTLTTFSEEHPEDTRYIDIVEAMDLIEDDIRHVFKTEYIGIAKNTTDNQMLFLASVNDYLKLLTEQDVLDNAHENVARIDAAAQRKEWTKIKSEAAGWSDAKIIATPFKRSVFLAGDIKINGAMENLTFGINMC